MSLNLWHWSDLVFSLGLHEVAGLKNILESACVTSLAGPFDNRPELRGQGLVNLSSADSLKYVNIFS